jgi:cyclopropane-fatty-acyl-phospholipid synthase
MSKLQNHPARAAGWRAGAAAWMLRQLISARLEYGSLTVRTPEGIRVANPGAAPGPQAELTLHRWRALRRLLLGGDLGFAEAYLDGDWDSPDLASMIELAARNRAAEETHASGTFISRMLRRRKHASRDNSRRRARRNIEAHYDLGNDFYAAWLDSGMTYSSALYAAPDLTLEAAQRAKQDRVLDLLDVRRGARVLEIGCGWGGLAERVARDFGAVVRGITLSPAQQEYAAARLASLPADILLRDYRDEHGTYDRIVAIEMLEAVGAAYWQEFFARIQTCLAPGGRAVLQVISIAADRFEAYLRRPDFIQHHVFPGGMLPTIEIMRREIARAGLKLVSQEQFGQSYAATLAEWHNRFELVWDQLRRQGFDDRFRRKWKYYLKYCEGGFRAGAIDVGLYTIVKASGPEAPAEHQAGPRPDEPGACNGPHPR